MWEYYKNKNIFITGASGFLGTALVYRLISQTPVAHIYLLCRTGIRHLEKHWTKYLPPKYIDCLYDPELITVIEGDITKPNLGIDDVHLQILRENTHIIIHAASSINLHHSLPKLIDSIPRASERVANLALQCPHLDSFVYISTAYANAFLYYESTNLDPHITETIHPLTPKTSISDEWKQVQHHGHSPQCTTHNFPWPYAYAKHLTERLITSLFASSPNPPTLLILRPSIIAPAQSFPYPNFTIPQSTPATILAACLTLTPSLKVTMSSRAPNPESQATMDEIPVDVVVDRLLLHLSKGTTGPVHAVSGKKKRYSFLTFWNEAMRQRRIPWAPRRVWTDLDWRSKSLHPIARLYVIYGSSFDFSDVKTELLWEGLSKEERSALHLFSGEGVVGLEKREREVWDVARIAERNWVGRVLFWLFYCSWVAVVLGSK